VSAPDERPPELARSMWKRFALAGAVVVVWVAAATVTAVVLQVKDVVAALGSGRQLNIEVTQAQAGKPQTIMLLGSDRRAKASKRDRRSDTIMLIHLDAQDSAISVMSIPRDLLVDIPNHGRQKINAAYSYGGARLTLRVVKQVLDLKDINHVVDVNFKGFREAVDRIKCVYVDVDRKYFHSNAGLPPSAQYAEIDIDAGYQKLCGQKALDFVRYRHADDDLVRAKRQQDFLRQAKEQVGVGKLFSDRIALSRIFGRAAETDKSLTTLKGFKNLLYLVEYAVEHGQDVRQVDFRTSSVGNDVTASAADLRATVREFLHPPAKADAPATSTTRRTRKRSRRGKRAKAALPPGLVVAAQQGQTMAVGLIGKARLPIYYPTVRGATSAYDSIQPTRAYTLPDRDGKKHAAYRMVLRQAYGGFFEYYGVQGTTWKDPPILMGPSERRIANGRALRVYYDGGKVRLVAWRTRRAVYWVSNTLSRSLNERQLLAIASTLRVQR